MTVRQLLKQEEIICSNADLDSKITEISVRAETAREGTLFFAINGACTNGEQLIAQAVAQGAVAVCENERVQSENCVILCDARGALARAAALFYGSPSSRLTVAGVTGTNGKTTTSYMLRSIIEASGARCGLSSGVEQIAGTVRACELTTPDAVSLNRLLREMVEAGQTAAVVEVSSHALVQKRVEGISFDAAVFTNLGTDHLDYHKTREEYLSAKLKLFAMAGSAAVNADDECAERVLAACRGKRYTYSAADRTCDVFASDIKLGEKTAFTLHMRGGKHQITLNVAGMINIMNALAAACGALALGIPDRAIHKGLESFNGVTGRLQRIKTASPAAVYIDFAHTPDALRGVLKAVREITPGRVIVVFGCGGDRDKTKRPLMGAAAAQLADLTVVTTCNPRSEQPEEIIKNILDGIPHSARHVAICDRKAAIEFALRTAASGDSILLAGKGHEQYQIVGNTRFEFDEARIARGAAERLYPKG